MELVKNYRDIKHCPKCGVRNCYYTDCWPKKIMYCKDTNCLKFNREIINTEFVEHLHITCTTCGYEILVECVVDK